ncbi:MAG: hypothetical protein JW870_17255 [Candidatus Delongbacteria bacterium]|nr:hypothetical protein [Candidatus Delongbacteria bacterium]
MSEKYKLQIIDDSSFNLSLEKVIYNRLGISEGLSKGGNLKLRTKDHYKVLKITNNEVKIEFIREKYFEPAGLFQIEIVITLDYRLRESNNKEKGEIIEEDLKREYSKLLSPAATRASILVSALTGINFKNPVVDPPYPLL